jgi:hypothetical protein
MINFLDSDFKSATACARCSHCVAVAYKDGTIGVRDTKDSTQSTLMFTKAEWEIFVDAVKRGEFDYS